MNNLLDLTNAGDKGAIAQTNFQRLDGSLAFVMTPSLDLTGNPTVIIGPPAAGTYVLGQLWVDAALGLWRCMAAGTPGAWIQQQPAVCTANPAGAPNNYWIVRADLNFEPFYYTGSAWTPTP